jgi:hypothetical protein
VRSVRVRLLDGNMVPQTDQMRTWLASRRFDVLHFKYRIERDEAVVEVRFTAEAEATAFANEFDGTLAAI